MDLGSNSFHLLIGRWRTGALGNGASRVEIIERLSEKVQLGEQLGATGRISAAAFQRGLACLGRFKTLMGRYPLRRYWAFGTNAFRVAGNAEDFIKQAAQLGISISIIDGEQEAALIYAGVVGALPESGARRLVVDVGGGSTELVIGRGSKRLVTESLPMGSVAWRDRFFAGQAGASEDALLAQMDAGQAAAAAVFGEVAGGLGRVGWDEVYASSGTMKMLAYICGAHGYGQGEIRLDGLRALKGAMASAIAEGGALPGLKDSRRDLLLPGWCVISALMETCGIDSIQFSRTALREGMLQALATQQ